MRISCDLKIISPKQLGNLAEKIEEIERQINGWINYSSKV
jgi:predicted component of type VI protein secretion system